jgi:hypothetical protein
MISSEIAVVAESGIFTAADVERLANINIDAILVGEAVITSDDIPAKVRELVGAGIVPAQGTDDDTKGDLLRKGRPYETKWQS